MKALIGVGLTLTLAGAAFAQAPLINTGPRLQMPAGTNQYGNILFPGGVPTTFAGRLGSTVSGSVPYTGVPPRGVQGHPGPHSPRGRTVVVPYAVPVYMGDPYAYAQPPQQQPVTVVVPQQAPPQVIINHHYTPDTANPVLRDYSNSDLPESAKPPGLRTYDAPTPGRQAEPRREMTESERRAVSDEPTLFLIAYTDGSVQTAIGYWVKDGTLHYVTPRGVVNRVTMDRVDRELSEKLNAQRKLEFSLRD